jgi:phosphotransferase system  glucose/maltose/N-acetylglucosamine-specific IIC component
MNNDTDILTKIKTEIVVPVIGLLFALALLYFLWGVVSYILNVNNATKKQEGQRHILWGIVGLAIMLSAFGIVNFVFNSVDIAEEPLEKPDLLEQQTFIPPQQP